MYTHASWAAVTDREQVIDALQDSARIDAPVKRLSGRLLSAKFGAKLPSEGGTCGAGGQKRASGFERVWHAGDGESTAQHLGRGISSCIRAGLWQNVAKSVVGCIKSSELNSSIFRLLASK